MDKLRIHYVLTEGRRAAACIAVAPGGMTGRLSVGISVRSHSETTWNKRRMRDIAVGRCLAICDKEHVSEATTKITSLSRYLAWHPVVGLDPRVEWVPKLLKPLMDVDNDVLHLAGTISLDHYMATLGGKS